MNHFLELLLECRSNINFTHFILIADLYHIVYNQIYTKMFTALYSNRVN